ncbi:MAG: VTT domain-containing protein [Caulobacterales bacterium]
MPAQLRRFLPLIIVALAALLFFATGLHREITLEALQQRQAELARLVATHFGAVLLVFFVSYVIAISLSLPLAMVLSILGGFLFGAWLATPIIVIASTLGSTIFFLLVKHAIGHHFHDRARGWIARLENGFRENAFNYVFVLRLIPVAPLFMVNLIAGLLDVKTRDFVIATFLGMFAWSFIFASVGYGLRLAFHAGESTDPAAALRSAIFSPEIMLALGALAVLGLAPVIIKRVRARA